jgi:uncharacterized LabA/DUF88 family protein
MLVTESADDRVMVFIDLANLQRAVSNKESTGVRLDFYWLVKALVGRRRLIGAYAFDAVSATEKGPAEVRRRLHDHLRSIGFRVVARDVSFAEERGQKEVDVALATELVAAVLRNALDVAILVSGDRDFVPAVERARTEGKRVEIAFFGGAPQSGGSSSFSGHLQRVADRVHDLDSIPLLQVL